MEQDIQNAINYVRENVQNVLDVRRTGQFIPGTDDQMPLIEIEIAATRASSSDLADMINGRLAEQEFATRCVVRQFGEQGFNSVKPPTAADQG